MKSLLITTLIFVFVGVVNAQVKTNFNNPEQIGARGKYSKPFLGKDPYVIPARNIRALLRQDSLENLSGEAKPFRFAEALHVDIDVVKEAEWVEEEGIAYGKFTVIAASAKSISGNFDKFYLPEGTELYVYSENGEMITGPVTEEENNENSFWGTWVYKGSMLTVDLKLPAESKSLLKLHISSIAYGYKDLYVSNFDESSGCNVNVVCAGATWENERNSVALILDANSTSWCTGALVNNTCNLNIPYLLTANHCFNTNPQQNVAQWKFTFQAWSSTCTPSQNANGITFNGSTLRARNAATDFCLVELSQVPPANSGITFSGWSRANVAPSSGASITHPRGDVMKIATYNTTITQQTFLSSSDWRVVWASGTVEPTSSGGPLYDNNRRIIGQVHGGDPSDICTTNDHAFFGRFDLSWTGGGTNTTRLSNWLDPFNSGAMTTNTINISNTISDPRNTTVTGSSILCTTGSLYTLNNVPVGATVTWTAAPASLFAVSSGNGGSASLAAANTNTSGSGTITFTINVGCGTAVQVQKTIWVGKPNYSTLILTVDNGELSTCTETYADASIPYPGPNMYITAYDWRLPYASDWYIDEEYGGLADYQYVAIDYYEQYPPLQEAIQIRGYNSCGWSYWKEFWVDVDDCGGYSGLTFGPNPTADELTISKKEPGYSEIVIHNNSMEEVYYLATSDDIIKIPVSGFPEGTYYLQVASKRGVIREQILIKR